MKKIILTGIIALLASASGFSQGSGEEFRSELQFGLKAGGNYSNVYNESGDKFVADPKLGLAFGTFLSIPIGTYIGIQPEVLLSQKGFSATGAILGSSYSFTRTTTYVDIPLLFSLKPAEFLSFYAGPQYSYLIKQKDVFGVAQSSIEQELEFKMKISEKIFLALQAD
ncbi:MAG: porin family protein [Bacteroidota bacterium]